MNTHQWIGTVKIVAGMLQQFAGLIMLNRALNRRGFEIRVAGEAQKAIGDAHCVLRAYHRRHSSSIQPSSVFQDSVHVGGNEPQRLS